MYQTINEACDDLQHVADQRNLEYSAEMLSKVYAHQYKAFAPYRVRRSMRQGEYILEHMNNLLETMISHYGPAGGGRWMKRYQR